jgi:ribulose kinase
MLLSGAPLPVPGVWGPYWSVILEGFWLMEGGQSATGRLIDHVIHTHPALPALLARQHKKGEGGQATPSLYAILEDVISELTVGKSWSWRWRGGVF